MAHRRTCQLPQGAHDDAVDFATMALNDLRTRGLEARIITYYRRLLEAQGIAVPNIRLVSAAKREGLRTGMAPQNGTVS